MKESAVFLGSGPCVSSACCFQIRSSGSVWETGSGRHVTVENTAPRLHYACVSNFTTNDQHTQTCLWDVFIMTGVEWRSWQITHCCIQRSKRRALRHPDSGLSLMTNDTMECWNHTCHQCFQEGNAVPGNRLPFLSPGQNKKNKKESPKIPLAHQ